jgi:ABC-type antimicrobial peptide transport system permease subunit
LLGLALAFPVLNLMGRFISDSMLAAMLPAVGLQTSTVITGLAVATIVGALAAVLPGWGASRLKVTDALRRTE